MQVAVLRPVKQIRNQIRYILRQCTEMQDMSLLIYNTDRSRTEHTRFFYKSARHNAVSQQKIIRRVRVKLI